MTERLEIAASAFDSVTPSTVTTRFAPSVPTETVCADPSESARVHGAGGDRPLLVFAFGSGVELSAPAGAEVAPSDCVTGVEAAAVPVEAPDPMPVVPTVPAAAPQPPD